MQAGQAGNTEQPTILDLPDILSGNVDLTGMSSIAANNFVLLFDPFSNPILFSNLSADT